MGNELKGMAGTCAANQYVVSALGIDDIVDIRGRGNKKHFKVFSCRLIGDSCVALIANSLEECKNYVKSVTGAVDWTQVSPTINGYTEVSGYLGTGKNNTAVAMFALDEKYPPVNGMTPVDIIKHQLKINSIRQM